MHGKNKATPPTPEQARQLNDLVNTLPITDAQKAQLRKDIVANDPDAFSQDLQGDLAATVAG
jgi:hypothetical protein